MSQFRTLKIAEIIRSPRLQVRKRLDRSNVERCAAAYRAGSDVPPVQVAPLDGVYLLLDGWHRLAALEKLGRDCVDIELIEAASLADAAWLAARANLAHGLPLKASERREVFAAYIRAGRYRKGKFSLKSLRDIGKELGSPHTTVRHWMVTMFPDVARRYRAGGDKPSTRGGLRERATGPTMRDVVTEAVDKALQAFRAVRDPEERGAVIAHVEAALAQMRAAGPWTPAPLEPDFEF